MSRKKIKQVDAIRQKTLENVIEEFLRHCRLRGLRVFFRFSEEREYMGGIGLKLLKEDETIKVS